MGGPRPWRTGPGESGLDARIEAFRKMREKGVEIESEEVIDVREVERKV